MRRRPGSPGLLVFGASRPQAYRLNRSSHAPTRCPPSLPCPAPRPWPSPGGRWRLPDRHALRAVRASRRVTSSWTRVAPPSSTPAPAPAAPRLLAALDELGIAREQVDYLFLTHVHLDHAGGAGQLIEALPNAKAVLHPRGAPHLVDPSKLIAGVDRRSTARRCTRQLYGEILPIPADRVLVTEDGMRHAARRHGRSSSSTRRATPGTTTARSTSTTATSTRRQLRHLLPRVRHGGRTVHAADDDAGALRPGRAARDDRPADVVRAAPHRTRRTSGRSTDLERLARDLHAESSSLVRIARDACRRAGSRARIAARHVRSTSASRLDEHGYAGGLARRHRLHRRRRAPEHRTASRSGSTGPVGQAQRSRLPYYRLPPLLTSLPFTP